MEAHACLHTFSFVVTVASGRQRSCGGGKWKKKELDWLLSTDSCDWCDGEGTAVK